MRPLLPGSPGCLAVVTSRNHLTGLIATQGAHLLDLDLLPPAEARERLATTTVPAAPRRPGSSITACTPPASPRR